MKSKPELEKDLIDAKYRLILARLVFDDDATDEDIDYMCDGIYYQWDQEINNIHGEDFGGYACL